MIRSRVFKVIDETIKFIPFSILVLVSVSCSDTNKHRFKLLYENSATLTLECGNCFYYTGSYERPPTSVVERKIDSDGIELLASIKFCGLGDTTPDAWIKIETDVGDVAEFGLLFPSQKSNPTLRIQSNETGFGQGCTRKDQIRFETFIFTYANDLSGK